MFLKKVSEKIGSSATYITLPGTGHYCGVWNFYGSETVYYLPQIFNPLTKVIKNYIAQQNQ